MARTRSRPPRRPPTAYERVMADEDATLLDLLDNVLNKGVVLSGDLTIGLARIDLIYARVSVLLCAADRILPGDTK
ncbi:MAG: gas vesicle protein GvpJ [Vicinamibacterales bacterium]